MTSIHPRTPVLIGSGQEVWRDTGPEPLEMWRQVSRKAAKDTGSDHRDVLDAIDTIRVVYNQTWQYPDPVRRLADELVLPYGIRGRYSGIGGTQPQTLVADLAESIMAGDLDLALVAGGEALATKRRLKKDKAWPPLRWGRRVRRPFPIEVVPPPTELAHQVMQAYTTFALFDSARRGQLGIDPDTYREQLGEELAAMSRIAAENPYAWFPTARTASEIITPTDDNRMVAYPYTKFMVSVMDIDAAGALLVASEAKADELGVPRDRRIYLRGWARANDPWTVAAHPEMWRSPAMEAAGAAALDMAGVGIDDVAHLDLYSCFTSSVAFAREALGVAAERDITVTGGLPYFGGAGSAYMVQSIATLMGRLREDTGSFGLASGVGMHMTKHAFGVYSSTPPDGLPEPADPAALQSRVDADTPEVELVAEHTGPATVVAYTVHHDRSSQPQLGIVVCELTDGRRCYAHITDPSMLADIEQRELVGQTVEVVAANGTNLIKG